MRGLGPVEPEAQTQAENIMQIPLHGKVAAGNPIEAIEGNEFIDVPAYMIRKGTHYALTISGESMIEDGILDGDVIVVKEQNTANNGDTVVAVMENEATVKRYYKKKRFY